MKRMVVSRILELKDFTRARQDRCKEVLLQKTVPRGRCGGVLCVKEAGADR